jgi:steroid Delta-isomerase
MPSAEDIHDFYDRYIAALMRHDLDAVMAMFATNAVLHDPVDGPVREGVEAIREFFGGAIDAMRACRLAGPVHISADCRHAAVSTYSEAELGDGILVIEAIDLMTFDDDGKVSTMTAFWGPTKRAPRLEER